MGRERSGEAAQRLEHFENHHSLCSSREQPCRARADVQTRDEEASGETRTETRERDQAACQGGMSCGGHCVAPKHPSRQDVGDQGSANPGNPGTGPSTGHRMGWRSGLTLNAAARGKQGRSGRRWLKRALLTRCVCDGRVRSVLGLEEGECGGVCEEERECVLSPGGKCCRMDVGPGHKTQESKDGEEDELGSGFRIGPEAALTTPRSTISEQQCGRRARRESPAGNGKRHHPPRPPSKGRRPEH